MSPTNTTDHPTTLLLRITAVLWIVWGLVHVFAGIITIAKDATGAVQGIADAVAPSALEMTYPDAAGAIINQHGFNLLWIGAFTIVCGPLIWRRSRAAVVLAAIVGGITDVGYFLFLDLGGFVHFVPGTVMTLVSGSAVVLGLLAISRLPRPAA